MKFLQTRKKPLAVVTMAIVVAMSTLFLLMFQKKAEVASTPITPSTAATNQAASDLVSSTPTKNTITVAEVAAPHKILRGVSKPSMSIKNAEVVASVESEENEENDHDALKKEDVAARWQAEFEMIKDPKTGQIPAGIHLKEVGAAKKTQALTLPAEPNEGGASLRTLPTIDITVRGPNNYGGRTRAIAFDKRNTQVILAGGVSSGVFRSTNGGTTWTRATPSGEVHGVTAFAQDPRAGQEDVWYCGTGENGNSAGGTGASYLGHGIWKSTDNGVSWTALTSTQGNLYGFDNDFDNISRILVDANGAILVTAGESIRRSADGGMIWTAVLGDGTSGNPCDLIYNAAGNAFYAGINGSTTGAGTAAGIYRSTDGITWAQIRMPSQLDAGGVKRIVLANVAATANILAFYETTSPITCTGGGTSNAGLQLYDATAMTWTDHSQKIGACAGGSSNPKVISFQGGYNMCITTKPDDANMVYLGGVEIYRLNLGTSDYQYIGGDQGAANATNLHVDNHLLVFEPGSTTKMWAANDGGLRHTDVTGAIAAGPTGGYTWTDRTAGYITYQYYRADINPTNGSNFVAGAAQDNAITLQHTDATAKEIHGGDGTCIGVISGTDFTTYNVIVATQNGAISRIQNNTTTDIQPAGQAQGFKTFFLLDADNTNHLYYPTNAKKLYRTRNANAIATTAIGDVTTGWEEITGIAATLSGNISALSVSRNTNFSNAAYSASDANRKMYIGTSDGKLYRLADPAFCAVAATPTLITPTGATGYLSDVAVNPYNDNELLVTYSNYGTPSVWYTADASVGSPTWTNVEGPGGSAVELGSARSAMIVKAGAVNVYVVGTSTGLYGTMTLSGATTVWERIGTSEIAFSPSVSLRLRASDNKAVLGTHGNGLFMLGFPAAVLPLDLLSFEAAKKENSVNINWVAANEVDFSHYNVQKSTDGKNFSFLTKIRATRAGQYQTMDEKPSKGLNYYRLEMVDVDGKKKMSKVVSVVFEEGSKVIVVYPNPTTELVTIEHQQGKSIEIVNAVGQVVFQQKTSNDSRLQVNVSAWARGVYFVKSDNEVVKFVKN